MKISSKLNELKQSDLNCSVFDVYNYNGLSMQELLCQFFTKINECIKVSNETIDLATWLVNEGLKEEVIEKLMLWLNDGTLEELINVSLFSNLNNKINSNNVLNISYNNDNVEDFGDFLNNINLNPNVDTLYFPKGTYNFSTTWYIQKNLNIIGDNAIFKGLETLTGSIKIIDAHNLDNISFKGIIFDSNNSGYSEVEGTSTNCISIYNIENVDINKCKLINYSSNYSGDSKGVLNREIGFVISECKNVNINNFEIENCRLEGLMVYNCLNTVIENFYATNNYHIWTPLHVETYTTGDVNVNTHLRNIYITGTHGSAVNLSGDNFNIDNIVLDDWGVDGLGFSWESRDYINNRCKNIIVKNAKLGSHRQRLSDAIAIDLRGVDNVELHNIDITKCEIGIYAENSSNIKGSNIYIKEVCQRQPGYTPPTGTYIELCEDVDLDVNVNKSSNYSHIILKSNNIAIRGVINDTTTEAPDIAFEESSNIFLGVRVLNPNKLTKPNFRDWFKDNTKSSNNITLDCIFDNCDFSYYNLTLHEDGSLTERVYIQKPANVYALNDCVITNNYGQSSNFNYRYPFRNGYYNLWLVEGGLRFKHSQPKSINDGFLIPYPVEKKATLNGSWVETQNKVVKNGSTVNLTLVVGGGKSSSLGTLPEGCRPIGSIGVPVVFETSSDVYETRCITIGSSGSLTFNGLPSTFIRACVTVSFNI